MENSDILLHPLQPTSLAQSLMCIMLAGTEGSNMIPPHLPVLCHDLGAAPGWVLSIMASLLCFPSSTQVFLLLSSRYKKELTIAIEQESSLERSRAQLEVDWQRRCEDTEREVYMKHEQLLAGLTKQRDQVGISFIHAKGFPTL